MGMGWVAAMLANYGETITLKHKTGVTAPTTSQQAQGVKPTIIYTTSNIKAYVRHLTQEEVLSNGGKYTSEDVQCYTTSGIELDDQFTWQGVTYRIQSVDKKHKGGAKIFTMAVGIHVV